MALRPRIAIETKVTVNSEMRIRVIGFSIHAGQTDTSHLIPKRLYKLFAWLAGCYTRITENLHQKIYLRDRRHQLPLVLLGGRRVAWGVLLLCFVSRIPGWFFLLEIFPTALSLTQETHQVGEVLLRQRVLVAGHVGTAVFD